MPVVRRRTTTEHALQVTIKLCEIIQLDAAARRMLDAGDFVDWSANDEGEILITLSTEKMEDPLRYMAEHVEANGFSIEEMQIPQEAIPILELGPNGTPKVKPGQTRFVSPEDAFAQGLITETQFERLRIERDAEIRRDPPSW
ncbi:hypothetical protein SAMN06265222_12923 [Neorhodopirellula lusitana]|uniref:Uncharacterized protein n=1 Tax=Neorhodopirellula lusitana TaxID=445327 RepID=A0ABY1QUG5_9BACT|nr:hypothetical protein SAMN06265222_12923 [Neorhodopirellula lusitana]